MTQFHGTTILARSQGRPRRPRRRRAGQHRRHGDEVECHQGAHAQGRQGAGRLRRLGGRRAHAVREVRGEARPLSRQSAARRGGAGQGLAQRPGPPPARGAARGGRPGAQLPAQRLRRADRAGRRHPRHRLRRQLRARRRARAARRVADRAGPRYRAAVARDRGRHLRLHQPAHHRAGTVMARKLR